MTFLTDSTATLFPVSATLVTVSTPSRRIIVNPLSHIHSLDTIPHQDKTPEDSACCTRGTRQMHQVEILEDTPAPVRWQGRSNTTALLHAPQKRYM
jgi:hypothetical protein